MPAMAAAQVRQHRQGGWEEAPTWQAPYHAWRTEGQVLLLLLLLPALLQRPW